MYYAFTSLICLTPIKTLIQSCPTFIVIVFLHPEDVKIVFFQTHSTGESFAYVPVEPQPDINTDENVYFVLGFGLVFKSIQLHNS